MLPWGAGQFRLAHRYAGLDRWSAGAYSVQRMRSGAQFRLDLSDRPQTIAFMVRDYSPAITAYIASRLSPNGVFVDVGGHIGLISFDVAVRRPDVTIHAFEPNEVNVKAWLHNQGLNSASSAQLTRAGLGDREGEMRFDVPTDSSSGMVNEAGEITVPVTTLDRYCAAQGITYIDVLKIDVQGHEAAVLHGASELLDAGAVGTVICEICEPLLRLAGATRDDVVEPLKRRGFRVVKVPATGLRALLPRSSIEEDLAFERC